MKQSIDMLENLLSRSQTTFPTQSKEIDKMARTLYKEYCKKEEGKPKKITMHTVENILPCIAFYQSVIECTNENQKAYSIIEKYFEETCTITAKKLRKLCSIPFVYRLVPKIMAGVIHKVFGVESGFEMHNHQVKGKVCHINMTKCPYFSYCEMYGC